MYRRALDHYEHGDYGPAALEFQRLLYPPKSGMDPEKTRRAHLYRGISLFLLEEKQDNHRFTGDVYDVYRDVCKDSDLRPLTLDA